MVDGVYDACLCASSHVRWAEQKECEQADDTQWDGTSAAETSAAGM